MFNKISNDVSITVDGGYKPNNFKLKAGVPAKVTFTRVSEVGCTQQVIFNNERRDLPINEPVTFEFTPEEKGKVEWSCGMNMIHGKYVVK
ncbi:cupredoxin domain-containing protein [Ligilactobacillus sp. WILCCON 0076]|uniref:Cupredoxin domain-containing protein n=1 Tax=Ligilactobacillus ubinensis TaxID=2876789 RepID=A0A9X2FIV9_9LACO|nr:cupredoxin domain-containing protein [Ligilactobacillus ubinensis]MCP0885756.1 cupredoxin domain-containing protein [Ligilactobacillus ubinensis]